jgi:DNA-binding NarL/FixJ family response regulator
MSPRSSVFLLAENRLLREALARVLSKRCDISVAGVGRAADHTFAEIAAAETEILLLDALTSGMPEFSFVRTALRTIPELKVLLLGMEDNEDLFLRAVRAGVAGYLLREASALDVVAGVRAVAQGEAVCPPRLCLALFRQVARERERFTIPAGQIQIQLGLTRRQQQLVPLIAQGLTNKEIATQLNLSEQTVKNHIHRMIQRVGADGRLEVVELVRTRGAYV